MYCLRYVRRRLWILYTFLHFLLLQTLRTLLLLSFLLLFLNNENIFKKAGRGGRHILLPHLENIVDMFGYFHANKNNEQMPPTEHFQTWPINFHQGGGVFNYIYLFWWILRRYIKLWHWSKQKSFLNHRLGKYFLSFPTNLNWNFGNTIIHHCIGLWIIHFGVCSVQTCDLNVDAETQCIDKLRTLYCDAFSSEIIKFACTDFRTPIYNVFERRCSNKISIRNEK